MRYLTLVLIILSINCYSQITFERKINLSNIEFGGNVIELDDGYVISGFSKSQNNTDFDIVLLKLDLSGNVKWLKYLGEKGKDERSEYISLTNNGFLVCGTQDYDKTILFKTNNSGDSIWHIILDKNKYIEYGKSVTQINDSIIICIGGNDIESAIYFIDTLGSLYNTILLDSITITEVHKYNADKYALIGTIEKGENSDIYFAIYDINNKLINEKRYGGSGDDIGFSITSDKNGDLYILGHYDYQIPDYGNGILTLKINANGDTIWHHTLNWILKPTHICVDLNLNCYFSSSVKLYNEFGYLIDENFGIVKIDSIGNYKWYKEYDGLTEFGNNFHCTRDMGFILVGYDSQDLKILKLDKNAQIITGLRECYSNSGLFSTYPNPVTNKLIIKTSENIQHADLITLDGKTVLTYKFDKNDYVINMENIQSGIYLLLFKFKIGQTKTIKIIKI